MSLNSRFWCIFIFSAVVGCLFFLDAASPPNALAQFKPPFPPPPGPFAAGNGPGDMRGGFVSRLDRDGDNRVSREEFDGPADHFDVLDQNRDGFLSEAERPGAMGPGHRPPPPAPFGPVVPESSTAAQPGPTADEATRSPAEDEKEPGWTADETEGSPPQGEREQSLSGDEWEQAPAEDDGEQGLPADEEEQSPTAGEIEQGGAESEATGGATTSRWPWGVILPVVAAFVLALIWGLHSSRRFRRVKDAVAALNPHLLGVNIDNNIVITEVTEALCRATGFKDRDLVGKPLMALGSPTDKPGAMHDMWRRIKRGMAWKGEVKLVRKNGSVMWADAVISPLRRKSEKSAGYTVFYQDISKRKHFENLSMRDELTGLFNRRYFNEVFSLLWVKARREQQLFGLCILDVDNFKLYNDTYGHPAGDKVLTDIGRALTNVFQRRDDMVFRLGGEEFGVIFVVNDSEEAIALANKTLQEIRDLRVEHKKNPPGIVTASMGLKLVDANNTDEMEVLYHKADQALYEAKQAGRDRFVVAFP